MMINRVLLFCVALAVFAAGGIASSRATADDTKKKDSHIYELRTYTTAPGRLPALHKRFREHTMRIFKKHGIKNIIYWTPTEKKNTLVYVVAHKSRAAAEKSWEAFGNDPEWKKVYEQSREDGPIVIKVVRQFLKPTYYSPLK